MTEMRYEAPTSLDDAVALLAGGSATVLAGGTDVLVQMHMDLIEPDLIVDIKNIAELREVAKEKGGYRGGLWRRVDGQRGFLPNLARCHGWGRTDRLTSGTRTGVGGRQCL